jgi:SAM-dependent methyltransferase
VSNVGKWDRWYYGITMDTPQTYGDETTYRLGHDWLQGCNVVYDLGCGKGGFTKVANELGKRFGILGVDGSNTPFADVHADLAEFKVDLSVFAKDCKVGVFMRHVIEHDHRWEEILRNAASSFNYRMFLVICTPLQDETRQIDWHDDIEVPDIGFALQDVLRTIGDTVHERGLDGVMHVETDIATITQYGSETTIAVELRA